jgi:D-alanyl-D-alanine carboxypeptidase
MNRRIIALCLIAVLTGTTAYYGLRNEQDSKAQSSDIKKVTRGNNQNTAVSFDKKQHSLTDPASIWIVANKQRPLQPKTYVPADLTVPSIQLRSNITNDERQVRRATADALVELSKAAATYGVTLTLESGYRSYNFQVNLYNRYVQQQGQDVADTQSARAGFSEHQTGLAADVGGITRPGCNVEQCFADTPEGQWVAANAFKYGFIIRYPEGKTPITGYTYEPWHLRYVGVELATEMHTKNILTLEEFFELSPAPDYN